MELLSNGIFRYAAAEFEHFLKTYKFHRKFELAIDYSILEKHKASVLIVGEIVESSLNAVKNALEMCFSVLNFIPSSKLLDAILEDLLGVRINYMLHSEPPAFEVNIEDEKFLGLNLALEFEEDGNLDLSRKESLISIEERLT